MLLQEGRAAEPRHPCDRTMPLSRHTGQLPESTWTLGFREMTEPWKGAVGCLGVAVFFAMTIGIISWQALEQSPEEWVLRGRDAGMLWERGRGALLLRALPAGRPVLAIAVGSVPATEPPPPRDRCWHDGGQFCYSWEEDAELRLSLEPPAAPGTECYGVRWTPLRPDVTLKVTGAPLSRSKSFGIPQGRASGLTTIPQLSYGVPLCPWLPVFYSRVGFSKNLLEASCSDAEPQNQWWCHVGDPGVGELCLYGDGVNTHWR